MAGDWWKNDTVATEPPAQAPQSRGGVFIPDEGAIADARRADTSLGLQVQGNERANQQFGNDVETRARQGMGDIRKEFTALPEVKKYGTVVQQVDTILHTRPDAAGDQDLLYAIAQLRDPLGSVRESDSDMIAAGQSAVDRNVQELKRQLGSGGVFTDEYRNQLRREAVARLNTANRAYSQARNQYAEIARAANYDPSLVIGPHAGTPYYDRFKAYDEANGLGRQDRREQPSDPRSPFLGMNPEDLSFEDVQGTGAFGPSDGRLNPAQQSALDAFLKANAGNPNFGPEQLGNFYKSIGVEVGSVPASPAFFDAVRKGEPFDTTPDPTAADAARKKWAEDQVRAEMQAMGMDTINSSPLSDKGWTGGFSDELNGVRDGIRNLFTGDGSFVQGYRDGRDITRAAQDMSREQNGVAPEIISSLMTPAGLVSRANMARDAMAMGALTGIGEGDGFTDTVSKALTGGALGYGAGKLVEKVAPAIADSALAKKASEYFGQGRDQKAQDFTEAAKRQGLDYMAADIPGATKTKFVTSIAKATLGGIPLSEAAQKIAEKARVARDRIAGNVGQVAPDAAGAGQAARRGLEAWERQTDGRGGQLFKAIPIPPKTEVSAENTRAALAEITRGLESNSELSRLWTENPRMKATLDALTPKDIASEGAQELAAAEQRLASAQEDARAAQARVTSAEDKQRTLLQGSGSNWGASGAEVSAARREVEAAKRAVEEATTRSDKEMAAVSAATLKSKTPPVGGKISWEDMRRLRSIVGKISGKPSLSSDGAADAAMRKFYGALTQDIEQAAAAHSPEAAKAFSRANNYWRGRQDRIDNVMVSLLGQKGEASAESTFQQLERWSSHKGGDFSKLARAIRSMPPEEANTVRATIIDRLGDANPGAQGASNDNFSADTFLTQWSKLGDRAKAVLFQGEHRKALDDLATVFEGAKFSRGFDNKSRTGLINSSIATLGATMAEPISGITLGAAQLAGGKLLSSPRFARWLVALGKKPNESAQLAHIGQLTAIARAEPVIANDIFSLQQRLADQFQKSPGALAAQDTGDGRREPPAQGERNDAQ